MGGWMDGKRQKFCNFAELMDRRFALVDKNLQKNMDTTDDSSKSCMPSKRGLLSTII